ncbi:MAG: response regulator [Pseudanabaena sp. ELA607]
MQSASISYKSVIKPFEPSREICPMLKDPELRQEAYQYFLEEAPDLLKNMERHILALEPKGQPFTKRREHAYEVMRATHTLKGGAATFDLKAIKIIAHTFEDLIKALYKPEVKVTPKLKQLLLEAYGCLHLAYESETTIHKVDEQNLMEHTALIFSKLQEILGNDFSGIAIPSSTEMGFDYVESVFTSGVTQKIKELEEFLRQKAGEVANPEILMILHSYLEVFSGLGLSLNLTGFSEIAHLGDQALAAAPKHWEAIMSVVLADFQNGATMIRQGDRQLGGQPSEILMAWAKQGSQDSEHKASHQISEVAASPVSEAISAEIKDATKEQLENLLNTLEDVVSHKTDHISSQPSISQTPINPDAIDLLLDKAALLASSTPQNQPTPPPAKTAAKVSSVKINQNQKAAKVSDHSPSHTLPIIPVPVEQSLEQALQRLDTYTNSRNPVPKSKPITIPQPSATELSHNLTHNFVNPSTNLEHLFADLDSANVTNLDRYVIAPEITSPSVNDNLDRISVGRQSDLGNAHPDIVELDITPIPTNITQVPDVDTADLLETFSTSLEDLLSNFNIAEEKSTIDWLSGVFEPESNLVQSLAQGDVSHTAVTETALPHKLSPEAVTLDISEQITEQIKAEVIQQVTQNVTQEVMEQIRHSNPAHLDRSDLATWQDLHSHPFHDEIVSNTVPNPLTSDASTPHGTNLNPSQSHPSKSNLPAVRVGLEILERLQYNIGEIWVNQHRETNNLGELQQSIWELTNTHNRLRQTLSELARMGEKSLWSSNSELAVTSNTSPKPSSIHKAFDAIEFDQYGDLHLLLHQALEDMAKLDQSTALLEQVTQQSQVRLEQQQRMLDNIRDDLVSARMQSLGDVLQRCYYVVEQLSQRYQKSVQLHIYGTDILVDKAIADKLYDPLLHLLRNAFDHGIESPSARNAAGKNISGAINIIAQQRGGQITIEVCDDGQGINYEAVREKAINLGLADANSINRLTNEELTELLFEPGFSTAKEVSDLSGRGIGLDVVRVQLQNINGSITVKSLPHQGTSFTLRLPVSLTIARLMLVKAGQFVYAVLTDAIDRVVVPKSNQIHYEGQQKLMQLNVHASELQIPLITLESVMQYHSVIAHHHSSSNHPNHAERQNLLSPLGETSPLTRVINLTADDLGTGRMAIPTEVPSSQMLLSPSPVILLHYQTEIVGLEVDQVIGDVETLIRPLGNEFSSPAYIYGCCILGNGQSYLVIDAMTLVGELYDQDNSSKLISNFRADPHSQRDYQKAYLQEPEALPTGHHLPALSAAEIPPSALQDNGEPHRILVVDDSVSQRKVLKSVLEHQGFAVVLAKDGKDAVQQLTHSKHLSLVICDIEMPRMNGFEFLSYCRHSKLWRSLPVIMLTSRTSSKHRNIAMELGAQEYITKPFNESILIETIHKLLASHQLS